MSAQEGGIEARLRAFLEIREGEGALVAWLFAHAFFGGIPLTLTTAAANALFLAHHSASMLPWVYLAAAFIVPLVGWICLRVEHVAPFDRFLIFVVSLIFIGEVGARASIAYFGPERGTWVLPVWTELEYSLTNLELWALAGRLLNVQQAKRLLGVVGSGALLSGGLAGFLSPLFVRFIDTENLIVLSAVASLTSLFVLRRIIVREQDRLEGHSTEDRRKTKRAKKRDAIAQLAPKPIAITKRKHAAEEQAEKTKKKPKEDKPVISPELKPYLRATYALMALSFISYYFIERIFYDRAEARFADPARLASFIGLFMGACGFISLIFRAWLSAKLLSRWGLLVGLLSLPILIAVGACSATVTGLMLGGASSLGFFIAVTGTRGADRVLRESLDLQAVLMLYQPLPKKTRVAVQGMAEAVVGPIAGGFAGLALIGLEKAGVDVAHLAAFALAIGIAWTLIANHLRGAYRKVLERALADRRVSKDDVVLGESARAPLLRALESNWAGEVLYALDMLEEVGARTAWTTWRNSDQKQEELRPAVILKKLLEHASPDVRREALRRIEKEHIHSLIPDVMSLLEHENDERVRGRAYRVLAAISDDDEAEKIWALRYEQQDDERVRRELMTGCLASGSIDRIAVAWHELRRLAESPDPQKRVLATQVLRKVANSTFYRPLVKLLDDPNRNVQRAAIVACKTVRHPRLLPLVIRALRSRGLRAAAGATLVAIGEPALVPLRELVHDVRDWRVRVRALRVAMRVKGKLAERLALDLLESHEEEVRHVALLTLVACGYRPRRPLPMIIEATERALETRISAGSGSSPKAGPNGAPSAPALASLAPQSLDGPGGMGATIAAFERLLQGEITDATWTLAAIIDVEVVARVSLLPMSTPAPSISSSALAPSTKPGSSAAISGIGRDHDAYMLVSRALRRELAASRERILLLLSFLYDADAMHAARASYASGSTERRAIALELLDNTLPASVRAQVIPLFDDIAPKQALEEMPADVTLDETDPQGRKNRLIDLVDPKRMNVTSWTRACALWALCDSELAGQYQQSTDEDVRDTARFIVRASNPPTNGGDAVPALVKESITPRSEGATSMLTIEKVLILRSIPIFERTPDHILSELAGILKEVDVEPDVEMIKQGDYGDCMFVIVHGSVKVHRGDEVLARLGARDLVGEMSVLDPEPRSASVTTIEATRLLRIDRDDFFDLMADRIEIAQGILGVLCQRLRGRGSRSFSMIPPFSEV